MRSPVVVVAVVGVLLLSWKQIDKNKDSVVALQQRADRQDILIENLSSLAKTQASLMGQLTKDMDQAQDERTALIYATGANRYLEWIKGRREKRKPGGELDNRED